MGPLLLQLLANQRAEIKFKQETCDGCSRDGASIYMTGPKEIDMRGYVPALVRVQKVSPATASISQARDPGSDKHKAGCQYPR